MPVIANIVINDGATTPVAHTFTPIGKDSNNVHWFEQILPLPATAVAAKRIGYKQTRGVLDKNGSLTSSTKVSYTLHVPTPQTLGTNDMGFPPPPTLAYREMFRAEFELAERSTKQERKDTRALGMNLLASAMAVSNVDDLQPSF